MEQGMFSSPPSQTGWQKQMTNPLLLLYFLFLYSYPSPYPPSTFKKKKNPSVFVTLSVGAADAGYVWEKRGLAWFCSQSGTIFRVPGPFCTFTFFQMKIALLFSPIRKVSNLSGLLAQNSD